MIPNRRYSNIYPSLLQYYISLTTLRPDRVLATVLRYKRPVYIELARDVINSPVKSVSNYLINVRYEEPSDPLAMAEALL
jgi:TPP-dependent 2-oxoacid decarboxylase